ncbi:MAG: dCTP deaminase [Pirellulaceae bacterium]
MLRLGKKRKQKMILSNVEIHDAIDKKRLIIKPEPSPRTMGVAGGHCPYNTHSVDLRLSPEIVIPTTGKFSYDMVQAGNLAQLIKAHSQTLKLTADQPFILEPGRFVLGKTLEWIELPITANCEACLAARIEGKSSFARLGMLVHFTAPTVHPDFEGTLTLEMINLGPASIILRPDMYIAQLIVEEVKGCPNRNPSQFQGQRDAVGVIGGEVARAS